MTIIKGREQDAQEWQIHSGSKHDALSSLKGRASLGWEGLKGIKIDDGSQRWGLRGRSRAWPFRSWEPGACQPQYILSDSVSRRQRVFDILQRERKPAESSTDNLRNTGTDSASPSESKRSDKAQKKTEAAQGETKKKKADTHGGERSLKAQSDVCTVCSSVSVLPVVKGLDDTEAACPCGGCVAWGDVHNQKDSELDEIKYELVMNGIRTDSWGHGGNKSVWDLMWERKNGQIVLKRDAKNGKFSRFTRQLRIKLFSWTHQKDQCVLMERGEKVVGGQERREGKFITKRMAFDADWKEESYKAITKELKLDRAFQEKHFTFVQHETLQERQPAWSYPGLWSVYNVEEVHFKTVDFRSIESCGLPSGIDFTTTTFSKQLGGDKEIFWTWEPLEKPEEEEEEDESDDEEEVDLAAAINTAILSQSRAGSPSSPRGRKSVVVSARKSVANFFAPRKSVAVGLENLDGSRQSVQMRRTLFAAAGVSFADMTGGEGSRGGGAQSPSALSSRCVSPIGGKRKSVVSARQSVANFNQRKSIVQAGGGLPGISGCVAADESPIKNLMQNPTSKLRKRETKSQESG